MVRVTPDGRMTQEVKVSLAGRVYNLRWYLYCVGQLLVIVEVLLKT